MVKKEQVKALSGRWWSPFVVSLILLGGMALWVRDVPVFVDSFYWNMAVSLVRDGDLFLLDGEPKMALTEFHLTTKGHLAVPHFAGGALIAYPFLSLGKALRPLLHPEDASNWNASVSYGPPGRYWLMLYNGSVFFCGVLSLILIYRICRRLATPGLAVIAVIATVFSTETWLHLWFTQGGSELVAVLFIAFLIWFVLHLDDSQSFPPLWGLLIGLLIGFSTFIRLQSIIWSVLPIIYGWRWLRAGRLNRRQVFLAVFMGSAGFILSVVPQLLIYKCWFDKFFLHPYGDFLVSESPANVIRLLPQQSGFVTLSLVPFIGLLGLFFFPHRYRSLVISFIVITVFNLIVIIIRQSAIETHFYLGSRYCIILGPVFTLGLACLFNRLKRFSRLSVLILVGVLTYMTFMALAQREIPPDFPIELRNRMALLPGSESLPAMIRNGMAALPLAGQVLCLVFQGPKSLRPWLLVAVFFPFAVAGGVMLGWSRRPVRRGKVQFVWSLISVFLLLVVTFNLVIVVRAIDRSADVVARWEEEGRFDNCWRTLSYDWANCVDGLQDRTQGCLKAGQMEEAVRTVLAAAVVKPINEGMIDFLEAVRIKLAPEKGAYYLWQELYNEYSIPGVVFPVPELDERAVDGDVGTIGYYRSGESRPPEVIIELDRTKGPLSDVLVVFSKEFPLENIKIEVSSDGIEWGKPFRCEYWNDLLWIWDFHQRPWRYLRLGGFESSEEASIREVFAIFSPRHSR